LRHIFVNGGDAGSPGHGGLFTMFGLWINPGLTC